MSAYGRLQNLAWDWIDDPCPVEGSVEGWAIGKLLAQQAEITRLRTAQKHLAEEVTAKAAEITWLRGEAVVADEALSVTNAEVARLRAENDELRATLGPNQDLRAEVERLRAECALRGRLLVAEGLWEDPIRTRRSRHPDE